MSANPTITFLGTDGQGRGQYRVTIDDTLDSDVSASTQWSIPCGAGGPADVTIPESGTIVSTMVVLEGGTGTTVAPLFGYGDGFAVDSRDHLSTFSGTPAATVRTQTPLSYHANGGSLEVRSGVDAGTDNQVFVELLIVAGLAAEG